MKRGIIIVATDKYKDLALDCLKTSLKHTGLPVLILHEGQNRDIKTRLIEYTPFEQTLFIDADSVIQAKGVEAIFDYLEDHDIVFNELHRWQPGDLIYKIYKDAFESYRINEPVSVYNGAIFAFRKSPAAKLFFNAWNEAWKRLGSEREMPALAIAVYVFQKYVDAVVNPVTFKRSSTLQVAHLPTGFFEPKIYNPAAIVQHWYGPQFARRFKTVQKQKPKFACDNALNWKIVKW
jgi:hypothetical protein